MTSPAPSHPKPSDPAKWDTWIDNNGGLFTYDGTEWVPYDGPPPAPVGGDPLPAAADRFDIERRTR